MKMRAVCLLMSAVLVASVLSGCGDKNSDSRAEEAMNDFGSAMEAGDEDAAMSALEEFDNISEKEENQDVSEGGEVYPADPRWADVKPTEFAAQYNDVFIKSGMTLEEVIEEIDNSETFLSYYLMSLDQEIGPANEILGSYRTDVQEESILYDGDTIFTIYIPKRYLGESDDVFTAKDIPILWVSMSSGNTIYDLREEEGFRRILLGTYDDITEMSKEDVENLQDTFFAGLDVKLETERGVYEGLKYIVYKYIVPFEFSWNGYSVEDGRPYVLYEFTVDADKEKVIAWSMRNYYLSSSLDWSAE